uniref:Uncharacterized protein n=1 Tax=Romanomermis culicivorax TaxID=13658 RepID=A0A915KWE2_ROMCU
MQQTLSALPSNMSAQGHSLPKSESNNACRCSGFGTGTNTCPTTAAAEICDASYITPVNNAENDWRHQRGRLVLTEGGNSSSVTDPVQAVWLTDLARKYPHLPWGLLNELFEVEALMAANMVLSAPAVLQILGPEVARRGLEFIANGTIWAMPVSKILLDDKPLSPAVDTICWAVEQASRNAQPTPAIATLPSTMTTGAQMLSAIVQQQPLATVTNSPTQVANAFGETLHAINDDVSIIEALPFLMATIPQSPKIGVLHEVHQCGGLVINFPGEEPILWDDDQE